MGFISDFMQSKRRVLLYRDEFHRVWIHPHFNRCDIKKIQWRSLEDASNLTYERVVNERVVKPLKLWCFPLINLRTSYVSYAYCESCGTFAYVDGGIREPLDYELYEEQRFENARPVKGCRFDPKLIGEGTGESLDCESWKDGWSL